MSLLLLFIIFVCVSLMPLSSTHSISMDSRIVILGHFYRLIKWFHFYLAFAFCYPIFTSRFLRSIMYDVALIVLLEMLLSFSNVPFQPY